jgi:hypothetical protein
MMSGEPPIMFLYLRPHPIYIFFVLRLGLLILTGLAIYPLLDPNLVIKNHTILFGC